MNPTVDNDLQKAIDDITKNTNVDPVFSDPVAAPSSIPEGDSGIMEPVGPISDIKPASVPHPPVVPAPAPMPPVAESAVAPAPMPAPMSEAPAEPAPAPVVPEPIIEPAPEPIVTEAAFATETVSEVNPDIHSVKEAALRDLAPLVNKINMDPSKKFNLYKNIREELHDDSVIAPAYEAAKNIADESERGEALLYLVESIDNM